MPDTIKSDNFLRQNPINGEWVIYSPDRSGRPLDFVAQINQDETQSHRSDCPFCPGNETFISDIIYQKSSNIYSGSTWSTRAVLNKYPALDTGCVPDRSRKGIFLCMGGYGHHEVIIETPVHNQNIPQQSLQGLYDVIDTYVLRYHDLMTDFSVELVTIFKNHGKAAGTSLHHPHSQIIASPTVPRFIRLQEDRARQYFDDLGECLYCVLIKNEIDQAKRIVAHSPYFIAFVPFAAKVPFEIWIMPMRHTSDFGSITEEEKNDLAHVLKDILNRLLIKLHDPAYNYVIHSYSRYETEVPFLHWFLQIIPRLNTPAGFELGSGFTINSSIPENDAANLNKDLQVPDR